MDFFKSQIPLAKMSIIRIELATGTSRAKSDGAASATSWEPSGGVVAIPKGETMTAEVVDRSEMTWVSEYFEAHEVLMSPHVAPSVHNRHAYPITGKSVITLTGNEHLERRRTELPIFAKDALVRYEEEEVGPVLEEALTVLESDSGPARIDVLTVMKTALLRVAARIIGLDDVETADRARHLHSIAERIGEGASVEWTTRPIHEVIAEAMEAKQEFVEDFFHQSRQRRERLIEDGESGGEQPPIDLITVLLKHYPNWDDDQFVRECTFYLAASSSTTTHAAPHVLNELLSWIAQDPSRRKHARDIGFLKNAVGEALRLHPPVPALLRQSHADFTLASGRRVSNGEALAVDLVAANRDPSVFGENAEVFDPYRDRDKRVRPYGASFGMGAHSCPGRPVAMGSGLGRSHNEGDTMGVIVRMLEVLFNYNVAFDPADPPQMRTDTVADRYAAFTVTVTSETPVGNNR